MSKNHRLKSIARDLERLTSLLEVTWNGAEGSTGSSVKSVVLDACNAAHKLELEVKELIDPD